MKLKVHTLFFFAMCPFYFGSASASLLVTSFTGQLSGFNGAIGNVHVSFEYDSDSSGLYAGRATISDFGDYAANDFILISSTDHYLYFDAPTVTGTTTKSLHLYGNFFNWAPSEFVFDNRSLAIGNTYGGPHFGVDIDNLSVLTVNVGTSPVPVPAAAWLFATGLIGLVGVARRKKS